MLYDLIPNMPDARLLPLIERFAAMLAGSPCLPILSGWCEHEGSHERSGTFLCYDTIVIDNLFVAQIARMTGFCARIRQPVVAIDGRAFDRSLTTDT